MKRLNAYLHFNGNCREAMEFYRSCLGGELNFQPVRGSPMADRVPADQQDQLMHSMLVSGDMVLMASDSLTMPPAVKGTTISLSINGDSKDDIKAIFDKLSAGGKTTFPLQDQFFGTYGALTDKFGMDWNFQAGPMNPPGR